MRQGGEGGGELEPKLSLPSSLPTLQQQPSLEGGWPCLEFASWGKEGRGKDEPWAAFLPHSPQVLSPYNEL